MVSVALAVLTAPLIPSAAAVTPSDIVTTLTGTGTAGFSGDGGPSRSAQLSSPRDSDVGPDGAVYIADTFNNRIRRIAPDGTITTIVGTGAEGSTGDGGPGTAATITWPHDVVVDDSTGIVYIADSNNHRIRQVDPSGTISAVAGSGVRGFSGDGGLATLAKMKNPKSIALFGGALYVLDSINNRIRKVDLSTGIITTIAGTGAVGYTGDGGPATAATFNAPQRIVFDESGRLYVADTLNNAVRRIDLDGTIATLVGTGALGSTGDGGSGVEATVNTPRGLAVSSEGILYISDTGGHRVRALDLSSGVISRLAGTGVGGYTGDGGAADLAQLRNPRGLTLDNDGRLLIAETMNHLLRVVTPAAVVPVTPVAAFTVVCDGPTCAFDASESAGAGALTYAWDFGDATTGAGVTARNEYGVSETCTVGLVVTDGDNQTASSAETLQIDINEAEPIRFVAASGANVSAGKASVVVPAATSEGDSLLLFETDNSGTTTATPPAGWALVGSTTTGGATTRLWQKSAGAADAGSTVLVRFSAVVKADLALLAYSGTAPDAPVATWAGAVDRSLTTSHSTPRVSTAASGHLVVSYWADKSSSTTRWTAPVDQLVRRTAAGTGTARVTSLVTDSDTQVDAGEHGAMVATTDAASRGLMVTVLLAAAG